MTDVSVFTATQREISAVTDTYAIESAPVRVTLVPTLVGAKTAASMEQKYASVASCQNRRVKRERNFGRPLTMEHFWRFIVVAVDALAATTEKAWPVQ